MNFWVEEFRKKNTTVTFTRDLVRERHMTRQVTVTLYIIENNTNDFDVQGHQ